jgi:hypothetical protein
VTDDGVEEDWHSSQHQLKSVSNEHTCAGDEGEVKNMVETPGSKVEIATALVSTNLYLLGQITLF